MIVPEPAWRPAAPETAGQRGRLLQVQVDWAVHSEPVVWADEVLLLLVALAAPMFHRGAVPRDP